MPSALSPSASILLRKSVMRRQITLPLLDATSLSSASSSVGSSPGEPFTPTDSFVVSDTNLIDSVDSYFKPYIPIDRSEKHLDGPPSCFDQPTFFLEYCSGSSVSDGSVESASQATKISPYSAPIIIVSPPSSENYHSLEDLRPAELDPPVSFTRSRLETVLEEREPDDHNFLSFVHGDVVYSTTGEDDSADCKNIRKLHSSTGEECFLKIIERGTMEAEILKRVCSVQSPNAERPVAVFEDGPWTYCIFVSSILLMQTFVNSHGKQKRKMRTLAEILRCSSQSEGPISSLWIQSNGLELVCVYSLFARGSVKSIE